MEICYFSNFKAKSNLRKCTDSPEPSLIAEMRKNIEIRYFSIFEAQSSLRQEYRLGGEMQQYQGFYRKKKYFIHIKQNMLMSDIYPACFFVFWNK